MNNQAKSLPPYTFEEIDAILEANNEAPYSRQINSSLREHRIELNAEDKIAHSKSNWFIGGTLFGVVLTAFFIFFTSPFINFPS